MPNSMPMPMQFNFGHLASQAPAARALPDDRFCIALMGDFSGRAHRGERRTRDELSRMKPVRLDADSFDAVIQSFGTRLRLALGADQGRATIELNPRSLDDLHPDALYDSLPLFAELALLRKRLAQPSTFAAAAATVRQWAAATATATAATAEDAAPAAPRRQDAVRTDGGLIDFVALFGLPALQRPPSPIDVLIRAVVQPHLQHSVARESPDAPALIAAVDQALSVSMRELLHNPDFQALEAAWRSLNFLMRRVETDRTLQLWVYDISAEEFAADLAATDALENSGLYQLLVAQPALDAQPATPLAWVGLYSFALTAPHAELLGRAGTVAAHAGAPFIAAIAHPALQGADDSLDSSATQAWQALRDLPAARHLALATPGFLLRQPYGKRSDAIERFAFEELDRRPSQTTLLWGHPAVLAAVLLAQHVRAAGADVAPARQLDLDNLPLWQQVDADGGDIAPSCTEGLLTDREVGRLQSLGLIPLLQHRGQDALRFGGFMSLKGEPLAGRWGSA